MDLFFYSIDRQIKIDILSASQAIKSPVHSKKRNEPGNYFNSRISDKQSDNRRTNKNVGFYTPSITSDHSGCFTRLPVQYNPSGAY